MNQINIEKIIASKGLNFTEVAKHLFPDNKYPRLALNRVKSGEANLDSEQVSKLALFAGISISEVYAEAWSHTVKKNTHTFNCKEYRAELDTETWITKIFHKDSLFHEKIINSGSVPMSEYFKQLNLIIQKFKTNGSTKN